MMAACQNCARVAALATMFVAASAAFADEPLVVHRIADADQAPKNPRGHVHPAVCVAHDGTVVVAHFGEAAKKIYVLQSTDGGRSFTDAGAVPDIGAGHPYPGALTTLADGRIVLFWNSWITWPDLDRGRRPAFVISADAGRSWSAPKQIELPYHRDTWIRHRLLEQPSGAWILPMSDRVIAYDPSSERIAVTFLAMTTFGGPLVQSKAGTLLQATGYRSTDEGRNWSRVRSYPAVNSYRCDMLALDNGWIVAGVAKELEKFWLNVSYDDGLSWNLERRCVIYDPGHEIGNSAPQLAQLDSENLGIVFWDHNREQPGGAGVYFARLSFNELRRRTTTDR